MYNAVVNGSRFFVRPSPRRLAGLVLVAVAALVLLVPATPDTADAQSTNAYSTAQLLRAEIEEGTTRDFQITNIPDHPRYFIYLKPLKPGYTAEPEDFGFTVERINYLSAKKQLTPSDTTGSGSRTIQLKTAKWTWPRLTFEVEAKPDDDMDDETFGVQLCTTVDCTGGTILGNWTVTIKDAVNMTTLTGTGTTIEVSGGHTTVMEDSHNTDNRDHSDDITIKLAAVPTEDIVVLAKVDEQVRTGGTDDAPDMRAIARVSGSTATGAGINNNPGDWYVAARFPTMITVIDPGNPSADPPVPSETTMRAARVDEMVAKVNIVAQKNIQDTPDLTGVMEFRVVTLADSDDTNKTDYSDNDVYSTITLPNVPVTVTGDDDRTMITLLPAASPDNIAKEGSTSDTAKFRVKLGRELVAGEWIAVPLAFTGAELGTHFTLSLDGSPTGVTYTDSTDKTGKIGLVRFTGPSAAEATVVVTGATNDGNNVSENLAIRTYLDSKQTRGNRIDTNLFDGVCAGEGCSIRISFEERYFRMTIEEAVAGLAIIDGGNQRLLEDDIVENVPVIERTITNGDGSTQVLYEFEEKVVVDGGEYSYDVRLSAMPSNNVTIAVSSSDTSRATIKAASASLTFTTGNWMDPQTVTVSAVDDSTDSTDSPITITHDVTGQGAYASIADVTYELTLVDDDPTTVTMTGAGVRTSESGKEISNVMVEGDPTRVDRTLTISLGRALTADEYVRVPLYLEATGHTMLDGSGGECDLSRGSEWTEGIDKLPDWGACAVVDSLRGPRYSANVAWPDHFNDFEMRATGTGVTLESVNRYTPTHVGYRIVEFRGAGAQDAKIEFNARGGFNDGETFHEQFSITFPNNLRNIGTHVVGGYVFQPRNHINPRTNLGGGVTAAADLAAWYGITDDENTGAVVGAANVPSNWPLLPSGLGAGDQFRLIYVTSQTTQATDITPSFYDSFVRTEITGNSLVSGGVTELADHANSFRAIVGTATRNNSGVFPVDGQRVPARTHARFNRYNDEHPNVPIYWVGGAKVADDNADFVDSHWDDEANPRHADGTAATINTNGYWTGSQADGRHNASSSDDSGVTGMNNTTPCQASELGGNRILAMGAPYVHVGILNDNSSFDKAPLGPDANDNNIGSTLNNHACKGRPNTESLPMYALSGLFVVEQVGATIAPRARAAEGSAIRFTVTIPDAAPSGGITIPYTFEDGLGIDTDPAHIIATGASGGTGNGTDYDNDEGSVTIGVGQTTATFTVATTDDSTYEGDHYFRVTLGTPRGTNAPRVITGKSVGVGVITDEADRPVLEFSAATSSVAEGASSVDVTVTKTGTTLVPASVYWTTADDTASHPTDYRAQSGYLEIERGATTKTLTIDLMDDEDVEGEEAFKVQLDGDLVVDAQVGSTAETVITLTDDDIPGVVRVSWSQTDGSALNPAPALVEGDTLTVKVSLSQAAPAGGVTIPLKIDLLSAEAADVTIPTSVTIAAGQTSATFDIVANIDEMLEDNDLVNVTLCPTLGDSTCPEGYTSGDPAPFLGLIIRDPGVVTDVSSLMTAPLHGGFKLLAEGSSGTFTIALRQDPTVDATISFKPVDGDIATLARIISATASDHIAVDTDLDTAGFQNALTFTGGNSGNWSVPQTVRIHALYDDDADTGTAQNDSYTMGIINSAASGPYKAQVNTHGGTIRLTVSDAGNDVVVLPTAVEVATLDTVEYDVQLTSDPGGSVVITPTSGDTSKATVSGALTFTSSNWQTPQQVTVTGAAGGSTSITHAVTTATTAYPVSLTIDPVSVTVTSPVELSFDAAAYTVVEGDGTVSVTVNADTAPASALTVNLTTGNGTTQGSADFTAPPATFTFPSGQTSHNISITIANDGTKEGHERFRLTLGAGSGYSVGTPPSTDVTILNDDGSVNVTLGRDRNTGDANGNIVEGASDGTEYIDITVTLGRVLRGGERINAGIFFTGAARGTDYTLALHPSSQTGVSLQTTRLGANEQNPGVQLDGAGAWRATLRMTAVDNDVRTQPFVDIRLKTDTNARVRQFGGLTLGTVHTGPIQLVIMDDETGDIVVPEGWSLAPSGVAGGDDFRLFFMSSTQRNANPTDIDVYNNWIRKLIVDNGHAAIKPYAGFFKVFGSTSGANARVHNGMWTGSAWTDASKNATDAGTAIYWLNGLKVADNYWDFCDESWDNRNHGSGLQVRLENGNLAIHSNPRTYVFTGTNANCTSGGNVLGANDVKVGFGTRGSNIDTQGLHHTNQSNRNLPKGNNRPFWGMSPVFTKAPDPELEFGAATYSVAEGDGTIDVTVTADRAPSSALTVNLATAGVTATDGSDYTAPPATFTFPASMTSHTFSVTITDDSLVEGAETFTLTLTAATGYGVGSLSSTTVTITDNDELSITMAGTGGDANGNVKENANDSTGYRTITLTLGSAPPTGNTVTVPLTVSGATLTTDYTFGLQPATQTGVTLDTSSPHSAQDPAVVFAAGATTATFRLTQVNNDDRTQPYVYIDYGTGARAPSATGGIMLDEPKGPQGIVLVDDEEGAIEVLTTWGLTPSGLNPGDDFRLLFRTSTGRDATSSDIGVYDAFVRSVLAGNGHEDIKPYAGFFKVFGGTMDARNTGAGGTTPRVHNGMHTIHIGHLDDPENDQHQWADGSRRDSVGSTVGTPTYWLNGAILANNYADMCDVNWSGGNGVTTGWDTDDPRSEDGTRNVPAGSISDYDPYSTWTGSGNACEAYNHPLGFTTVSRSSADKGGGQSLLHEGSVTNTGIHPLYGYSPVFTLQLPPPVFSFGALTYNVSEGAGSIDVIVKSDRQLTSPQDVNISAANGTAMGAGTDFTNPPADFTFPVNVTSHTISVTINNDSTVEQDEDFTLTLGASDDGSYMLAAPTTTTVTILDDDGISVTMTATDGDSDGNAVEGASNTTGYRTITLTLNRALTGQETVTVPLSVVGATVTTDYTFALQPSTQMGVTLTTTGGTHTAQNPAVQFASGATTATLRLTPVDNNVRTQPYVIVDYGTGSNAPSATGGISLGTPRGGPVGIVLVDNETVDIVLPAGVDFRPQVGNNAEYRLIFMTSEGGPATSTDIADYDHFVRSAAIRNGGADLLPYVGFFKAFVSTATVDGREHIGIWDPSRGGSGGYADGSTGLSSGGRPPIGWAGNR